MLNAVRIGYARVPRTGGGNLVGELHLDEEGGVFYLIVPQVGPRGDILFHRKFIFQGIQAEILSDADFEGELRGIATRNARNAREELRTATASRSLRRPTDDRDRIIEQLREELDYEKRKPYRPPEPAYVEPAYINPREGIANHRPTSQELLVAKELEAREFRAKNPPSESVLDPLVSAMTPDPDAGSPLMAVGRFVQGMARPNDLGTMDQVHAAWTNKESPQFFNESVDAEIEGGLS